MRFSLSTKKMNDLKFAFRQLVKNPGFTAVANRSQLNVLKVTLK